MGFDFFGSDVNLKIFIQPGVQLNPGRYSSMANGKPVRNPEDPDVVTVGVESQLAVNPGSSQVILKQGGNKDGLPLDFLRSMMTRCQLLLATEGPALLEIDIEPPTNDLALAMLNSNLFARGNTLALRFGYSNSPSQFYPGLGNEYALFFMQLPDLKFGSTISFTLRCQSNGMMANQLAQRSHLYKNRSPKAVVDELARRSGLKMVEPTSWNGGESAWNSAGSFEQNLQTDWAFLHEVLGSIPGKLGFVVEGAELRLVQMSAAMTKTPRAVFRWGHALAVSGGGLKNADELPIFTFSSDTVYASIPTAALGVQANSVVKRDEFGPADRPGRTTIPAAGTTTSAGIALQDSPAYTADGKQVRPWGSLEDLQAGMQLVQSETEFPNSKVIADNFAQQAQFYGNWNIEIGTIGIPTFRPFDLIQLKGFETVGTVTEKLNGSFLIQKLVHTLGSDGFNTQIYAFRNNNPGEGVRVNGPVSQKTTTGSTAISPKNVEMQPVFVDPESAADGAG